TSNLARRLFRRAPPQRIVAAVVKALNLLAVEAIVADLHPGPERAHGGIFLDREADRLGRGGEAAIAERLACAALALGHEQLGRSAVVERHALAFARHLYVPHARH